MQNNSQTQSKLEAIREGFGKGLVELAKNNSDVIGLSADLSSSVRMSDFAQQFPDRYLEIGIAEQNMAGIAAGLALAGKIPYIGSFASFQPMRNLDQIRTSICIMDVPVKIVSSHAGFSFAGDGVQIQALEDIAIMRSLPNMEVFVPADSEQARLITLRIAETGRPAYLRLGRKQTPLLAGHKLVDSEIFSEIELGKAQVLQGGGDATIIATGYMVELSLQASAQLRKQGIYAGVINLHTIKPIDTEAIVTAAEYTGRIITVEEAQLAGGMGSAVLEVLSDHRVDCVVKRIGVEDQFGTTAETTEQIWMEKGLTVDRIIADVRDSLR